MTERSHLVPNKDHPISIVLNPARIVVRIGDTVVADTRRALALHEASYPPVQYIPREDVDMALLAPSRHASYCPYKGEAGYFDLPMLGDAGNNAVWTYEAPYEAVARISRHVAFYPDRVTIVEEPV